MEGVWKRCQSYLLTFSVAQGIPLSIKAAPSPNPTATMHLAIPPCSMPMGTNLPPPHMVISSLSKDGRSIGRQDSITLEPDGTMPKAAAG